MQTSLFRRCANQGTILIFIFKQRLHTECKPAPHLWYLPVGKPVYAHKVNRFGRPKPLSCHFRNMSDALVFLAAQTSLRAYAKLVLGRPFGTVCWCTVCWCYWMDRQTHRLRFRPCRKLVYNRTFFFVLSSAGSI